MKTLIEDYKETFIREECAMRVQSLFERRPLNYGRMYRRVRKHNGF